MIYIKIEKAAVDKIVTTKFRIHLKKMDQNTWIWKKIEKIISLTIKVI